MLLGRAFAYNDAQRNRIGTNFHQLPVNQPKVPVNTYMFDGQMAYHHSGNRARLRAEQRRPPLGRRDRRRWTNGWEADGEMVRSAYTLHAEDDDFAPAGHPGARGLQRRSARALVEQVAGSLLGGVRSPVLGRAFDYWKNIDAEVGRRIEEKVRAGSATKPAEGMGEG